MSKFKLSSNTPLDGFKQEINGISIVEIADVEIFALALKNGVRNKKKAISIFKKNFGCSMPNPGHSNKTRNPEIKVLRTSPVQIFIIFKIRDSRKVEKILSDMDKAFYITEQSDVWSGLTVSGRDIISCLERVCPIDIATHAFGIDCFARTVMEHLGVIIIRCKENEFELFSSSSSAKSFLNVITTSARNIST